MNFPHRPDVPIPPQSDLQLRLSILFTPEILTELSAIFPAKNPNIPKSNSFGLFNFILIVRFGESRSFRKSNISYGMQENDGIVPIFSYDFLILSCFFINSSSKL